MIAKPHCKIVSFSFSESRHRPIFPKGWLANWWYQLLFYVANSFFFFVLHLCSLEHILEYTSGSQQGQLLRQKGGDKIGGTLAKWDSMLWLLPKQDTRYFPLCYQTWFSYLEINWSQSIVIHAVGGFAISPCQFGALSKKKKRKKKVGNHWDKRKKQTSFKNAPFAWHHPFPYLTINFMYHQIAKGCFHLAVKWWHFSWKSLVCINKCPSNGQKICFVQCLRIKKFWSILEPKNGIHKKWFELSFEEDIQGWWKHLMHLSILYRYFSNYQLF